MPTDPDETTALEVPADLLAAVVDAGRHVAQQTEAATVLVVSRAYREGWAAGFLARLHDEEDVEGPWRTAVAIDNEVIDQLTAERNKLVEKIADLTSLPPEAVAKAYGVGYGDRPRP